MRVSGLRWTTFRLPLRTAFATASGALTCREGLVLRLETDRGIVGLGEASPLPERGGGSLPAALAVLDDVGAGLVGRELEEVGVALDGVDQKHSALAAVRCALDVAVCDAMAKAAGVSVAELLTGKAAPSVPVNTTIGAPTTAEACDQAAAAQAAGFGCVKLKVGMARSVEEEWQRVAAVRDALGPGVRLRVDANGAWGVEQAVGTIRALEAYDLEFVEQPVAPGDPGALRRVREAVETPIAADEEVASYEVAQRVLEMEVAQVLVL
ncbi:MAG: mandelate racemase/muconate lactonizing enzyme family protein, partial [Dehalococcoidia bacterium]